MSRSVILLGVDALSYSSFMKCNPRYILTLFNSTFRGVVKNVKLKDSVAGSWLEVLTMKEQEPIEFLASINEELPVVKETYAELVNIPVTNPTYGVLSLDYENTDFFEEIKRVRETALSILDSKKPVIAAVTAIDRALRKGAEDLKCKLYAEVDKLVKDLVNSAEEFIVFSPFGELKSKEHEAYGVYISTVPRPHEHDVISLREIGSLFVKAVKH